MALSYYKIPLNTEKIVSNDQADYCSIEQSINSFIHLIITTHFGEYEPDSSFGCTIWDIDFDNLTSNNKLRYTIAESISESLVSHEKRIKNITVNVDIVQDEYQSKSNYSRVKKRVDIEVSCTVKQTNETFTCFERFFIAPLAY